MKKYFLIPVSFLIACIAILSCNKEKNEMATEPAYRQQLKTLSRNYLNNIDHSTLRPWKEWKKIISADLKGALDGAAVGAGIGTVVPGLGTGAGAGIGAVVGGAAASLDASVAINPGSPGGSINNLVGNASNEYDQTGRYHYLTIDAAVASPDNYTVNGSFSHDQFYLFSTGYLLEQNVINSSQIAAYTAEENNAVQAFVTENEQLTLNEFLNLLYESNSISNDVRETLTPYFECLDRTVVIADFVRYSIAAENIIAGSELSAIDKQFILGTMSTARYGSQYWGL
jgi:hypothetical protein